MLYLLAVTAVVSVKTCGKKPWGKSTGERLDWKRSTVKRFLRNFEGPKKFPDVSCANDRPKLYKPLEKSMSTTATIDREGLAGKMLKQYSGVHCPQENHCSMFFCFDCSSLCLQHFFLNFVLSTLLDLSGTFGMDPKPDVFGLVFPIVRCFPSCLVSVFD